MASNEITVQLNIDKGGALESYLKRGLAAGAIDYAIRANVEPDGRVRFYIHPATQSGETVDFSLQDGVLMQLLTTGEFA